MRCAELGQLVAVRVCTRGRMPGERAPLSTTVGMRHKGLSKPWWRHLNPFAPFDEGEAQYLAFKYQGLHESHMYACLAIIACTVVFATIYWGDQYLEDTIFPQVLGTRPHPCPCPPTWPSLSPFPLPAAHWWPSPLTLTTNPGS